MRLPLAGAWRINRVFVFVVGCPRMLTEEEEPKALRGRGETSNRGSRWRTVFGPGSLTDANLRALLSKLPALEALDISFNMQLTGAVCRSIGSLKTLRTLRWQHLGNAVESSPQWPNNLKLHADGLQRLDLSFLSPCPQDVRGVPRDIDALRRSLPSMNVIS